MGQTAECIEKKTNRCEDTTRTADGVVIVLVAVVVPTNYPELCRRRVGPFTLPAVLALAVSLSERLQQLLTHVLLALDSRVYPQSYVVGHGIHLVVQFPAWITVIDREVPAGGNWDKRNGTTHS